MSGEQLRKFINIVEYRRTPDDIKINDGDAYPEHWTTKLVSEMDTNPIFSFEYVSSKIEEMTKNR